MKLSVLFLICSLSMTYAAESYAQKTMISLEVRNETVGEHRHNSGTIPLSCI